MVSASAPLSTRALEARFAALPRVALGNWPTPLEGCPRLTAAWAGPAVYVKRDDLSGLALGGNKVRHLEFRIANALARGCDTIVMAREQYSNNARQTAAAAAKMGLRMVLLVPSESPVAVQGNRLIEELVGTDVRVIPTTDPEQVRAAVREAIERERAAGRHPYDDDAEIPKVFSVLGNVTLALELVRQCDERELEPAAVYVAGGFSQAGLVFGLRLLGKTWPVVGAAVELTSAELLPRQLQAVEQAAELLRVGNPLTPGDIEVQDWPLGPGFQHLTPEAGEAMRDFGQLEALILDPVYTAKVAACLRADARRGRWPRGSPVIFVHTGGLPALFSMTEAVGHSGEGAR